jgi:hypothetical protein
MGFFDRLFGGRKSKAAKPAPSQPTQHEPSEPSVEQFRQQLWGASPKSRCGVCGKELRGLSGGIVTGSGEQFMKMMMEGSRYICPKCGFVSCFECCADTKIYKVICKRCKAEMQRG